MQIVARYLVAGFALLGASGCATIVNDGASPIRVETVNAKNEDVKGAECKIDNGTGVYTVTTPGSVIVKRASADAAITCVKPGEPDGKGTAISRANAGMFGNIILGGGIGAIIDHSKGTAYTYPQWIRVVMGKQLVFDRSEDKDGQPNVGKEPSTTAAAPQPADTPSSARDNASDKVKATSAPGPDEVGQLEKLKALRDRGLISEDEYNTKKKQVLDKM
ncbi:MAG: SHOCT domain-containing protein [Burkholderiaceae bacterium]|nr:SHOCT domain-containing protein [Burkholderiaceae bacterium]